MHLLSELNELDAHHRKQCPMYESVAVYAFSGGPYERLEDLPFLHVSAFKDHELLSVPRDRIHRVLSSSGTSGSPSRVFIDRADSLEQLARLGKTYASRFGQKRRQMFTVSTAASYESSARAAAFFGFTALGRPQPLQLDLSYVELEPEPIVFGMTTDVWTHRELLRALSSVRPVVLHGGGWKRLEALRVTRDSFCAELASRCPGVRTVNWFGMVEQAGTVYFDCSEGCFHEHSDATFLVRSPDTLRLVGPSELGLLQVFSPVPRSYPGHSLLTDDVCQLVAECPCGDASRAFRFIERRKLAPGRGCANA